LKARTITSSDVVLALAALELDDRHHKVIGESIPTSTVLRPVKTG
jgi:hypothetical protein